MDVNEQVFTLSTVVMDFETRLEVVDQTGQVHALKLGEIQESIEPEDPSTRTRRFTHASPEFSATLVFTEKDHALTCRVEAEIRTKSLFLPVNSFAPYGSIRIFLKPLGTTYGAMGSCFRNVYPGEGKDDLWATPFFGDDLGSVRERIASMLWRQNDMHFHVLPLCDEVCKTDIHVHDGILEMWASPYCGGFSTLKAAVFALSWGPDPFEVVARTATAGFEALGARRALRNDKTLPDAFQYLGWCSWDAFHRDVSSKGILEKAEEFRAKGIPVQWMLIDDGWSITQDEKLLSFTEDRLKFPEGLKGTIGQLKDKFGIQWVGAWLNYLGYWQGIHPDSPIARENKEIVLRTKGGYIIPHPTQDAGFRFWNTWNRYLRNQGIDFIKSDSQGTIELVTHGDLPIGEVARGAQQALEGSVGLHYGGTIINCTGMGHETLWNQPQGAVARSSCDFMPTAPETLRDFIVQNLYNSFYFGEFYYPDWDMWWSNSATTKICCVLHALSGSILYVSDKVGDSDIRSILPFVLPDGRVLRGDRIGMPTSDCLFLDPLENKVLLKAWNRTGESGFIGAFNVHTKGGTVSGTVSSRDVPGLEGSRFAVYDWHAGQCRVLDEGEIMDVAVLENDAALFILCPLLDGFAPIGLLDKYLPTTAIRSRKSFPGGWVVCLKTGGRFGYVLDVPHHVRIDGVEAVVEKLDGYHAVDCGQELGEVWVEVIFDLDTQSAGI